MTSLAIAPVRPHSPGESHLVPVPSQAELQAVIPRSCFARSLPTSLAYAAISLVLTVGTGLAAWLLVPVAWAWTPVWVLYALVCGTFACGVWVIAHECGHGAFCDDKRVQSTIGFVLHSSLLVPYFSWQRSHAIHHAKTNHVSDGETHVPKRSGTAAGERALSLRTRLGSRAHATLALSSRLLLGWPLYLLVGSTGGPDRGVTNHFWPFAPFSQALFPARWTRKVLGSAAGVLATIGLLSWWASAASVAVVVAVYVGPYLVCNAWLVTYTWLQHTDDDVPHYDDADWSFVRGAFCSVDRPYGRIFDFLHHRIGSTHAVHHLSSWIPHYRAAEATEAVASAYPDLYRYDPTPVPAALWRAASTCVAVTQTSDGWRYSAHARQESSPV